MAKPKTTQVSAAEPAKLLQTLLRSIPAAGVLTIAEMSFDNAHWAVRVEEAPPSLAGVSGVSPVDVLCAEPVALDAAMAAMDSAKKGNRLGRVCEAVVSAFLSGRLDTHFGVDDALLRRLGLGCFVLDEDNFAHAALLHRPPQPPTSEGFLATMVPYLVEGGVPRIDIEDLHACKLVNASKRAEEPDSPPPKLARS